MGEANTGRGRDLGLLEGDRTACGPGRQWLRPAIFRRAPAIETHVICLVSALCIAKQNSRPSPSSAAASALRVLACSARRLSDRHEGREGRGQTRQRTSFHDRP